MVVVVVRGKVGWSQCVTFPFLPHPLPRCLRKLTRLTGPHLFPIILQLHPNNLFILHKLPHSIWSDVAHPPMQLR
jgi:hypothetical protein